MCQPFRISSSVPLVAEEEPLFKGCECPLVFAGYGDDACRLCLPPDRSRVKMAMNRLWPCPIEVIPDPKHGKLHLHIGETPGMTLEELFRQYGLPAGNEWGSFSRHWEERTELFVLTADGPSLPRTIKFRAKSWATLVEGTLDCRAWLLPGELNMLSWRSALLFPGRDIIKNRLDHGRLRLEHGLCAARLSVAEAHLTKCVEVFGEVLEWVRVYCSPITNPSPVLMDLLAAMEAALKKANDPVLEADILRKLDSLSVDNQNFARAITRARERRQGQRESEGPMTRAEASREGAINQ